MYSRRHTRRIASKFAKDFVQSNVQTFQPSNLKTAINVETRCTPQPTVPPNQANLDVFVEQFELQSETGNDFDQGPTQQTAIFLEELKRWAIADNIPHTSLKRLLLNLKTNLKLDFLPKDPRSLLQNPRSVLKRQVPPAKSSNSQVWPIEVKPVDSSKFYRPFVLGIYFGHSKPENSNIFLSEFVQEATDVIKDGFLCRGVYYSIKFRAIIADAPARSFITNTIGHNGSSYILMDFSVVEFLEDGETYCEVAPTVWITDCKKFLRWPNLKGLSAITTAVNRASKPEKEWKKHSIISIRGTYKTVSDARKNAKRIVDFPGDDPTDTEAPRKKTIPAKLREYKGSENLISIVNEIPSQRASTSAISTLVAANVMQHLPFPNTSPEITPPQSVSPVFNQVPGFEQVVISSLSVIKIKLGQIEDTQSLILDQLKSVSKINPVKPALSLPVKSLDELNDLERKLMSDETLYSELAIRLDFMGGRDVRKCTNKTMRKLMTDTVAAGVNWGGANDKKGFSFLEVANIVTIHYQFGKQKGNLSDIELAIKDWLKAAPQRIKINRKTKPSCSMTEQLGINGQSDSFSGDSSGHEDLGDE
ncbi:unnamed protein product [Allacma fusca]|uniref:DUF4806 domain-containing protein n=1 Tax=Allacma fusca TaxID=39272 RepID=A0A8J2JSX2_9HEXA|nr:unnamed protein product [Allacma fusca]